MVRQCVPAAYLYVFRAVEFTRQQKHVAIVLVLIAPCLIVDELRWFALRLRQRLIVVFNFDEHDGFVFILAKYRQICATSTTLTIERVFSLKPRVSQFPARDSKDAAYEGSERFWSAITDLLKNQSKVTTVQVSLKPVLDCPEEAGQRMLQSYFE